LLILVTWLHYYQLIIMMTLSLSSPPNCLTGSSLFTCLFTCLFMCLLCRIVYMKDFITLDIITINDMIYICLWHACYAIWQSFVFRLLLCLLHVVHTLYCFIFLPVLDASRVTHYESICWELWAGLVLFWAKFVVVFGELVEFVVERCFCPYIRDFKIFSGSFIQFFVFLMLRRYLM